MGRRHDIVELKDLHGRTFKEIGDALNISRQRAEQLYVELKGSTNRISVRERVVKRLGGKCVRCGFDDIRALQIDHVHGNGKKEITKFKNSHAYYRYLLGLDDDTLSNNYQILCANHNWIKRVENKETGNYIP